MNEIRVINGSENSASLSDAYKALIDFYYAFNNQNLELMENNWLQTEEASMSNPLGGIKRNWAELRNVYDRIFNGPAEVFVEFYDSTIHESDNMFLAVGHERGYFRNDDTEIKLAIRTSRIYTKINNKWKQIHHHGSIDQADLLEKYQTTVLQK